MRRTGLRIEAAERNIVTAIKRFRRPGQSRQCLDESDRNFDDVTRLIDVERNSRVTHQQWNGRIVLSDLRDALPQLR
jgi:hypothetical protein